MKIFETGKTYYMRSICDYDCIWRYKVIKRTKATLTIIEVDCDNKPYENTKKVVRLLKGYYKDREVARPLGNYSMSPLLTSEKIYDGAFSI